MTDGNVLYYGDNLDVLRRHVADASVDLVYLDPPFGSNADYNVLFAEHGEKAAAQVRAFEDTWEWNTTARLEYEEIVENGGEVAEAMRAFRTMLGGSDMLAYLSMMAPRLVELRRVIKPTGSLFLHCDPTASHYLKLLLDSIFGPTNFLSEIIWQRTNARGTTGRWPRLHDVILHYARSPEFRFRPVRVLASEAKMPHTLITGPDGLKYQTFELTGPGTTSGVSGQPWRDFDPTKFGRHWGNTPEKMNEWDRLGLIHWPARGGFPRRRDDKPFAHDARFVNVGDVWTDIDRLNQTAKERLGYPTQKPVALMARIIEASTDAGDVVLDPFCGCGTTIDAAEALDRRWIGIDITHLAIGLIKHRLAGRYGPEIAKTYRVIGEPTTVDDAAVLAKDDPFQFQAWALGLVGARVDDSSKRGGDKGIDGKLYFHDSNNGPDRQIIFSVKAGKLVPAYVRDLRGVLQREGAEIGVLLSFSEPTAGMRSEAAEAGFYTTTLDFEDERQRRYPRVQLRTIAELLNGKGIEYPHVTGANVTLRRAQRARTAGTDQLGAFDRPVDGEAEG